MLIQMNIFHGLILQLKTEPFNDNPILIKAPKYQEKHPGICTSCCVLLCFILTGQIK